jgi:hypothetical protein
MRFESVYCLECDHEHVCPVDCDEMGTWVDGPDECEACGEDMTGGSEPSVREDFHSDC